LRRSFYCGIVFRQEFDIREIVSIMNFFMNYNRYTDKYMLLTENKCLYYIKL